MTVFSCSCGFSCGAAASFARHAARMGEGHQLASGDVAAETNRSIQTVEITVSFHCRCGFTSGTAVAFERHCQRTPGDHANVVTGGTEVILASKTGIRREPALDDDPPESSLASTKRTASLNKKQLPPLPPSNPRIKTSGAGASIPPAAFLNLARIPQQLTKVDARAPPTSKPAITSAAMPLESLVPETKAAEVPSLATADDSNDRASDTEACSVSSGEDCRAGNATVELGTAAVELPAASEPDSRAHMALPAETRLEKAALETAVGGDEVVQSPIAQPACPIERACEEDECLNDIMSEGLQVAHSMEEAVSPMHVPAPALPVPPLPPYVDAYIPLELLLDTPLASPNGAHSGFSSTYNPAFEANFQFPETPEGSPKRWSLASTSTLELELDAVEGLISPTAWKLIDG
eukprot:jgi/Mesvir1/8156/Mv12466-RA.2